MFNVIVNYLSIVVIAFLAIGLVTQLLKGDK